MNVILLFKLDTVNFRCWQLPNFQVVHCSWEQFSRSPESPCFEHEPFSSRDNVLTMKVHHPHHSWQASWEGIPRDQLPFAEMWFHVCLQKNDGRIKMSYLAGVLVPLPCLEGDLSPLTSYVPTSSEIVPPGSLYTHWRKEDTMMMWHILPILDVCGRGRWNTHQKDLFLPSKISSDWWLEKEMLSTDHINPTPSFQKRLMQVPYIGLAFSWAEILHLAPCFSMLDLFIFESVHIKKEFPFLLQLTAAEKMDTLAVIFQKRL